MYQDNSKVSSIPCGNIPCNLPSKYGTWTYYSSNCIPSLPKLTPYNSFAVPFIPSILR